MMETQQKTSLIKNKSRITILASSLMILFVFKYYLLDQIIFKNENSIINSHYGNGEKFVLAIQNNKEEEIKIFLEEKKVNVNYVDSNKRASLLLWALLGKNYNLSKELIKRGASVNAINPENGLTPLHVAASDGCEDCVYMLVSRGADVNAREKKKNFTALDFAIENKRSKIVDYLKKITAE